MDLCDKLDYYRVKLFGHRIRALSYPTVALGVYGLSDAKTSTKLLSGLTIILGIGMYATNNRNATEKAYLHTKRKYKRKNGLNDKYFIESIRDRSLNGKLRGYCEQQGTFLAAKKFGYEKEFREAARRESNVIIPFF